MDNIIPFQDIHNNPCIDGADLPNTPFYHEIIEEDLRNLFCAEDNPRRDGASKDGANVGVYPHFSITDRVVYIAIA